MLIKIILENKKEFDIIFIQKILWSYIQTISSSNNEEGDKVVSISNHLS